VVAVLLGHRLRLRVAEVTCVVAATVAQVDAADERRVAAGTAQHHHLLVVRAAAADALVEQHLATRRGDVVAELAVLLLAVGQLLRVGTPHQPLDDDAAPGRVAQQLGRGGALGAEALVCVALPVGEEEAVARPSSRTVATRRAKYALPSTSGVTALPVDQGGSPRSGLPISSAVRNQSA
jgi:hypothetical protein